MISSTTSFKVHPRKMRIESEYQYRVAMTGAGFKVHPRKMRIERRIDIHEFRDIVWFQGASSQNED